MRRQQLPDLLVRVLALRREVPDVEDAAVHFRLRPDEVRTFVVQFQPTGPGTQSGSLTFTRDDGAQAGLAIGLSGRGQSWRRWRPVR